MTVEADLAALLEAGHSRVEATRALIERIASEARLATTVVLVEGLSDQIALEVLAERLGRQMRAEGTAIVPVGGATNFARCLAMFGPPGGDARLAGLYDSPVEGRIRRSLAAAGFAGRIGHGDADGGLEAYGFYRCVTDLEDEMIRTLGASRVEEIVDAEGELRSFRRLQAMPHHRQRSLGDQLHRFIGAHSGRKYRYARLLARELDPDDLPVPLAGLLDHL